MDKCDIHNNATTYSHKLGIFGDILRPQFQLTLPDLLRRAHLRGNGYAAYTLNGLVIINFKK